MDHIQFPTKETIEEFNITMSLCLLFNTDPNKLLDLFRFYDAISPEEQKYFYDVSWFIEDFMRENRWEVREYAGTVQDFCDEHPNGSYLAAIKGSYIVIKEGIVYSPCFPDTKNIFFEKIFYFFFNEGFYMAQKLYKEYCDIPKDEKGDLLKEWNGFETGTKEEDIATYFRRQYHFDIENGGCIPDIFEY